MAGHCPWHRRRRRPGLAKQGHTPWRAPATGAAGELAWIRARGVVNNIAETLLGYPVIIIARAAELHDVTYPPATNAIEPLVSFGVLRESSGQQYGRIYVCDRIRHIMNQPLIMSPVLTSRQLSADAEQSRQAGAHIEKARA